MRESQPGDTQCPGEEMRGGPSRLQARCCDSPHYKGHCPTSVTRTKQERQHVPGTSRSEGHRNTANFRG